MIGATGESLDTLAQVQAPCPYRESKQKYQIVTLY